METAPRDLPLTVSELNRQARLALENGIGLVWVTGEISRATLAASGHWYFTLKDESAAVDCAMFKGRAQLLAFRPENGLKVEVRARVTVYEARGAYQLAVEQMRQAGLGALFEAFERLKKKLAAEGLFDEERKRALPAFPRAIGVVTSLAAAALRDILTTLRRRAPTLPVVIYPTLVQGQGAAEQVASAIVAANRHGACDVLIVARGGGSLEDLFAFNEEVVARAIASSAIPVVSGVGHETDFTIADFVADLRAATPTAAAAAASPDQATLRDQLAAQARRLARAGSRAITDRAQRLDIVSRRLVTPAERLRLARLRLDELARRLATSGAHPALLASLKLRALSPRLRAPDVGRARHSAQRLRERLVSCMRRLQDTRQARLEAARASLSHLDPTQVLSRGYAIARGLDGAVVRDATTLKQGEKLNVTFAVGSAGVRVEDTGP